MKNIKFGLFFLGLAVAIGGAISVAAQDRVERPRPNVMVLDGRGAQLGVMVSDVDAHRRFWTDDLERQRLPGLLKQAWKKRRDCLYVRIQDAQPMEKLI